MGRLVMRSFPSHSKIKKKENKKCWGDRKRRCFGNSDSDTSGIDYLLQVSNKSLNQAKCYHVMKLYTRHTAVITNSLDLAESLTKLSSTCQFFFFFLLFWGLLRVNCFFQKPSTQVSLSLCNNSNLVCDFVLDFTPPFFIAENSDIQ